jgi:UDP-N-acetylmuramate--alanine ligase
MKVHFLGIGGIGVSALARYYLNKGYQVSGCDTQSSLVTSLLQKEGVKIFKNHSPSHISKKISLLVYSNAISPSNPEILKAKKLKIPCKSYPEALGEITKKYFTIAIAGTHGKGTTCAMLSLILIEAGFDPTVFIGTLLKEFGLSNYRPGKSKYLILEADEYKDAFLNYSPSALIITTIDEDHLDYFKNFKNILKSFKNLILKLPKDGILVLNKDDQGTKKLLKEKLSLPQNTFFCSISHKKEISFLKKALQIPGKHNLSNALLALTLARALKIKDEISLSALSKYQGAWRRFEKKEVKIRKNKVLIVSDYAHHPREIEATLNSANEAFKGKKIWVIFQPHQRQRTFFLFKEFVKVFEKFFKEKRVEKIIFDEIFEVAGREKRSLKISSKDLVFELQKRTGNSKDILFLPQKRIIEFLKNFDLKDKVILVLGAGDIYRIFEKP